MFRRLREPGGGAKRTTAGVTMLASSALWRVSRCRQRPIVCPVVQSFGIDRSRPYSYPSYRLYLNLGQGEGQRIRTC